MKKIILLALAGLFVIACQEKQPVQFTTSSPEISSYKKGIDAYEKADWATWTAMFADTAKIYHNNWDTSASPAEVKEGHVNTLSNLSSYGFDKDEMTLEQVLELPKDRIKPAVAHWVANKLVTNVHERGNCSVVCMQRLPYDLKRDALREDRLQGFKINANLDQLKKAKLILNDSVGAGMTRSSFLQKL